MTKRMLPLLAALVLLLRACGNSSTTAEGGTAAAGFEANLLQKSAAQTRLMAELAADPVYVSLFSSATDFAEIIGRIADADYDTPTAALIVSIPADLTATFLELAELPELELSDHVRAVLDRRVTSSISNVLSAQFGAMEMAATTIVNVQNSYQKADGLETGTLVVLLYGGDYCTITAFTESEENTMQAATSFVPAAALEDGTVEGLLSELREIGAQFQSARRYEGDELLGLLNES